ncbi:MAG TPA: gliding motility-associated C-terminal domain-containing protein, partial [Chryseosolibacter sp.]|nr:gliding motility-associated C-terminal domain-containing protein [Chryseosolibacter sp.]
CPVTGNFDLALDTLRSTPNIIDVVTVDPFDCFPTATAEVTKITLGSTFNSTTQPPNTPPDNTVTGAGLDAFTFNWTDEDFVALHPAPIGVVTSKLIDQLVPGTYFVSVTDPTTACQSSPREITINDDDIRYPAVEIRQSRVQILCIPEDEGSAELIAVADIGLDPNSRDNYDNYQFLWYEGLDADGLPIPMATDSVLSNIPEGEYSVSVLDESTNCVSEMFYVVPDQADEFTPKIALSMDAQENCVFPDGRIVAREVGFNPNSAYPFRPPEFYAEFYNDPSPDLTTAGIPMVAVEGYTNVWQDTLLTAGITYTIKVTDVNTGCFVSDTRTVPSNFVYPNIALRVDNPLTNCDPAIPNGQLSATVNGSFVGYLYDWKDEAGTSFGDKHIVSKLPVGTYTVTVTNEVTLCASEASEEIVTNFVLPPTPTATTLHHETDCKYPDGLIAASVGGNTLNYTFDWYHGEIPSGAPRMTGPHYEGLIAGIYSVTAKDNVTRCVSLPDTALVRSLKVIPTLFFETKPSFCADVLGGEGTGSITLGYTPSDIIADQVEWWIAPIDTTRAADYIGSYLPDLLPDQYDVRLVTSKNCEQFGSVVVPTEIKAYNLVTTNDDGNNDRFQVDCLSLFPNNNVKIFNRSGVMVYEADGYNNNDVVFSGRGTRGVYATGNYLPVGTYFYVIDKRDGSKPSTGYIELTR